MLLLFFMSHSYVFIIFHSIIHILRPPSDGYIIMIHLAILEAPPI